MLDSFIYFADFWKKYFLENHKEKLEKRKEKLFRLILIFAVKTVRKRRKHKRHLDGDIRRDITEALLDDAC